MKTIIPRPPDRNEVEGWMKLLQKHQIEWADGKYETDNFLLDMSHALITLFEWILEEGKPT